VRVEKAGVSADEFEFAGGELLSAIIGKVLIWRVFAPP